MLNRLVQFYRGLTDRVTKEDQSFLERILNSTELGLFLKMSMGVQVHSLFVAKTLMDWRRNDLHGLKELAPERWDLLLKGALLHDVGKPRSLKLSQRVGIVLFHQLKILFKKDISLPYRKNYLENLQHPLIGGQVAERYSLDPEVIEMIRNHHQDDPVESGYMSLSQYIRLADQVN